MILMLLLMDGAYQHTLTPASHTHNTPKEDNKLKYNIWISGFGSRVTRLILQS